MTLDKAIKKKKPNIKSSVLFFFFFFGTQGKLELITKEDYTFKLDSFSLSLLFLFHSASLTLDLYPLSSCLLFLFLSNSPFLSLTLDLPPFSVGHGRGSSSLLWFMDQIWVVVVDWIWVVVHSSLLWVEFVGHGSGLILWFVVVCYRSSVARL